MNNLQKLEEKMQGSWRVVGHVDDIRECLNAWKENDYPLTLDIVLKSWCLDELDEKYREFQDRCILRGIDNPDHDMIMSYFNPEGYLTSRGVMVAISEVDTMMKYSNAWHTIRDYLADFGGLKWAYDGREKFGQLIEHQIYQGSFDKQWGYETLNKQEVENGFTKIREWYLEIKDLLPQNIEECKETLLPGEYRMFGDQSFCDDVFEAIDLIQNADQYHLTQDQYDDLADGLCDYIGSRPTAYLIDIERYFGQNKELMLDELNERQRPGRRNTEVVVYEQSQER